MQDSLTAIGCGSTIASLLFVLAGASGTHPWLLLVGKALIGVVVTQRIPGANAPAGVPGKCRPRTDSRIVWSDPRDPIRQELLQHGLLRDSFVPRTLVRDLLDRDRNRAVLVQQRATVSNRIEKVLEAANIELGR
jgi:hypothetical protein